MFHSCVAFNVNTYLKNKKKKNIFFPKQCLFTKLVINFLYSCWEYLHIHD